MGKTKKPPAKDPLPWPPKTTEERVRLLAHMASLHEANSTEQTDPPPTKEERDRLRRLEVMEKHVLMRCRKPGSSNIFPEYCF